jgi:hypothetical protein
MIVSKEYNKFINQQEEETQEDQEQNVISSRNTSWGLDHEDENTADYL